MEQSNMKILAIIPARGGSKSVPRKNIRNLNGKPLIAYTIEAAKRIENANVNLKSKGLIARV